MENEIQTTESSESTAVETTEVPQTTEQDTAPEVEASAPEKEAESLLAEEAGGEKAVEEKPAYKPNFKLSVMDKEVEVPEQLRALMKDADSEKWVKDYCAKAEGIKYTKERLDKVVAANENYVKENSHFKDSIGRLGSIYQKAVQTGNLHHLDRWFQEVNIPQDLIIRYALEKVKMAELPPEQRQLIQGQIQAETQVEYQQRQNADIQAQFARQAAEMKSMQLESQMTNPETKSIADTFDARVGRPGAFKDEVRRVGQLAWHTEKVDLTPEQAIKRAIEYHGLKAVAQGAGSAADGAASGQAGQVVVKKPVSTLPNISGNSKSPVKSSKVKNLDELKKYIKDQQWA